MMGAFLMQKKGDDDKWEKEKLLVENIFVNIV